MQNYRNLRVFGVELIRKSNFTLIQSQNKLLIYKLLLEHAKKVGIFEKFTNNTLDPDEDVFPFEDITKLFPIRDLELIYKAFKSTGGKYEMMYRTFQELGMKE